MPTEPMAFDALIAPLTREQFLAEYWNKAFLHIKGEKGRFTPLLSWDDLNALLEWHCPPQPQLRMFQDGNVVDARRYIDGPVGALRLNSGALIALLAQGASMILDSVQEVSPPVSALLEKIQDAVDGTVTANVYAGWRKQKCFDLHWDSHDLIILQLAGRKHWKVYRPTRLHPLKDDIQKGPPPTEQPVWDGILEDGDMMHLPRGWWHVAYPLDEPSLHLSIAIEPPSGADFLKWWTREMLQHADVRQNLPRGADAAARKIWLEKIMALMTADGVADPVADFLRARQSGQRARSRVRLPMAPVEQKAPLTLQTRIRLTTAERLFIEPEADARLAKFHAAGQDWSFRRELVPVFERLCAQESVAVEELCAGVSGIDRQENVAILMRALDMLADAGVIFKEQA